VIYSLTWPQCGDRGVSWTLSLSLSAKLTPTLPLGTADYHSQHHQTSALLRKLTGATTPDISPVLTHKKRRPGWWSRRAEIRRKNSVSDPNGPGLPTPATKRHSRSCLSTFGAALLRQAWVPTQPLTILFAFLLLGCFAASLTTFLVHVLSSDKQRLPWRDYCQKQRPFPHALADSLAPVSVLVGVFSVDEREGRRNAIRQTYVAHSRPIDPTTGAPSLDVQVKFIVGRPRPKWAKRVALEMEMYNDMVVLDITENMNHGKTHAFFTWAHENATVPVYYQRPPGTAGAGQIGVGFKKVDYVAKADDDTFIDLSELERHLRIAPRKLAYWGYLVRDFFMAGELYALSQDLVEWVATYAPLRQYTIGKEDQRTANWLRTKHPQKGDIQWVAERCWIYDFPKAATTYAHGFLFPDEVERVRAVPVHGLEEASFSSVSQWKVSWTPPVEGMTVEEEVEALVEGGGRWANHGWKADGAQQGVPLSATYFANNDPRLTGVVRDEGPDPESTGVTPGQPDFTVNLPSARTTRFGKDLFRDPSDVAAVQKLAKRDGSSVVDGGDLVTEVYNLVPGPHDETLSSLADFSASPLATAGWSTSPASAGAASLVGHLSPPVRPAGSTSASLNVILTPPANASDSVSATESDSPPSATDDADLPAENVPTGRLRMPALNYILPIADAPERVVPPPTLRYDTSALEVRRQRMLGLPHGGTVAVHYLKRTEWFYETALALLGRDKMWDSGTPAPAAQAAARSSADGQDFGQWGVVQAMPPWTGKGTVEVLEGAAWGGARRYGSPLVRDDGFIAEGRPAEQFRVKEVQQPTGKWGRFNSAPRLALAGEDVGVGVGGALVVQ